MHSIQIPVGCSLLALFVTSARVEAQSSGVAAVDPPLAPQTPAVDTTTPPKRLQWEWGETKLKIGGYIKVDLIHDFDAIGSEDSFDPRTIPVDGSDGSGTRIHARQTRLNLDVQTPTSAGAMRTFVEGDFFSDQNGFRIRHAYGEIAGVLAGQTWTTFMDEDAMPETLDFESPIAFPLVRQAQIRYRVDLDDGNYAAFSLEDPDSDVLAGDGVVQSDVNAAADEPIPDLNARLRLKSDHGHVQLGGFLGMASYDPDVGSSDTAVLWGLNLSTKYNLFADDNVFVQATYGEGVGRYRGGTTAVLDADGNLEAVPTLALMGGYEHHWSEKYRSTLTYSWGEGDLPDDAPLGANEELQYLAANFIWQFADRAWTGIEYLYGSRDTFDGSNGEANRIQLSIRFDL